ncbi:MAG: imidazole glycerol phosphate synthase subunit HisH [Anaerosomatales bacterium]|nr:imidazole glycerol phosphate synthase subunit HisH [Anaerosomatales bacterium]
MRVIAIVDYGMGNLRSVQKGFEHAGVPDVVVTSDPAAVEKAHGVVLPGVGAFRDAAENLRSSGMWDLVRERVDAGVPLLGICLGMQLLVDVSYEDGEWEGLGLVPGACERLPAGVKVPHIGWNTVEQPRESALFAGIPDGTAFYFVHSYRVVPEDESCIIGRAEHGVPFAAAIEHGRVFGVQFHPEKSSAFGLAVLANFGCIVSGEGS